MSCEFKVPAFTNGKVTKQSRRSTPSRSQPLNVVLHQIEPLTACDNGIVGGHARHLVAPRMKYRLYVIFPTTSLGCCIFLSAANHQLHRRNDSSSVCLACCFTIRCLSPTLIFSPKGQFRRFDCVHAMGAERSQPPIKSPTILAHKSRVRGHRELRILRLAV